MFLDIFHYEVVILMSQKTPLKPLTRRRRVSTPLQRKRVWAWYGMPSTRYLIITCGKSQNDCNRSSPNSFIFLSVVVMLMLGCIFLSESTGAH